MSKLHSFLFHKIALTFLVAIFSTSAISEIFQLGDLAPRGAPDGQLNAADALLLQRMVLGDIQSSDDENKIGDVAPIGNVDGVLNAGDLVVQQRAILGEIILGDIEISSLPAPTLNAGTSPTNDNPYLISGTATPGAAVDIYVENDFQKQINADPITGQFSTGVYLFDGINEIYAIEVDDLSVSPPSNILQIQYNNIIDKNNLPANISVDTVWTIGNSSEPYVISSRLNISQNAKLIIQPGVALIFEGYGASIRVDGQLNIRGSVNQKVLLTASDKTSRNGWDGIYVDGGGFVVIDNAVIEYVNSRNQVGPINNVFVKNGAIFFSPGSDGVVTNTIIQNNINGIRFYGNTSPIIGLGNTITQNSTGLGLVAIDSTNPTPIINSNNIWGCPR